MFKADLGMSCEIILLFGIGEYAVERGKGTHRPGEIVAMHKNLHYFVSVMENIESKPKQRKHCFLEIYCIMYFLARATF